MSRIFFRPQAWRDISECAEYLETHSGIELAERFLDAVMETTQLLIKMPHIGSPCRFRRSELQDFRTLQVTNFERWLIFYQTVEADVEIARILHGARDLRSIFD